MYCVLCTVSVCGPLRARCVAGLTDSHGEGEAATGGAGRPHG